MESPSLNIIITERTFRIVPADKSIMFLWIYGTDIINVFWTRIIILQLRKPQFIHETGIFTREEMMERLKS